MFDLTHKHICLYKIYQKRRINKVRMASNRITNRKCVLLGLFILRNMYACYNIITI